MKFSVFQLSRKGGREKNEDRMGYCYTSSSSLFVLADGMGGHPQGEVAAQIAVQTLATLFQEQANPRLTDVVAFLTDALLTAHERILQHAGESHLGDTPRTTLVAAVMQEGLAHWIHCGDSRLYLVRDAQLLLRTRDHSYSEKSRDSQGPVPMAALNRNVLYTCLGSPVRPVFEIGGPIPLQQGDKVLLCSDGLWDNLSQDDIVHLLSRSGVAQAAPDLVDRALLHGGVGSDNVTVVAMEWETPDVYAATREAELNEPEDPAFSSTVQAQDDGEPLPAAQDLDDEAIERSIAEINEAIRRSTQRRSSI